VGLGSHTSNRSHSIEGALIGLPEARWLGTMFVLSSSPFGGKPEVLVHPAAKTSD